jgi:glucose-6-phosphate isomerase
MKQRKNSLVPLRFDPSGAFLPEHGITRADVESLYPQLEAIRDSMMGDELEMLIGKKPTPAEMEPMDAGFVMMPQRLLSEYEADRENSELAQLFKTANRLHETVDRVVVLGIGGSYMGARALMESCCQPYWNELSRAERGSRPRMYFEGNNVDNDATQGLLALLGGNNGQPFSGVGDRWGLVVISKSGGTLETATAFRQFLRTLQAKTQGTDTPASDLIVPITGEGGKLHQLVQSIGCDQMFPVPDGVGGRFSVLSAVGLVPAALLGINVIELLGGASAMTDHFRETPAAENVVLQHVAVNHLLEKKRGVDVRVLSVWSKALEACGLWYDQLSAESLGKDEVGFTPLTTLNTRDLHSRHQQHQEGKRNKVFNNVIVDNFRCDALPIGSQENDSDQLNEIADKTLPEIMDAAIRGTNEALAGDNRPTTNLHMDRVDELNVGQFLQMMMLATVVEGRLMGINPYGQPGVEAYKKNMNRLLGRS